MIHNREDLKDSVSENLAFKANSFSLIILPSSDQEHSCRLFLDLPDISLENFSLLLDSEKLLSCLPAPGRHIFEDALIGRDDFQDFPDFHLIDSSGRLDYGHGTQQSETVEALVCLHNFLSLKRFF